MHTPLHWRRSTLRGAVLQRDAVKATPYPRHNAGSLSRGSVRALVSVSTHARTRTHTRSRAGSLAAATAARARASHHPRATCHLPARLHASGHREPSLSLTFYGRRSPQWLLRQRDAGDTPLRAGLPWRWRVTAGSTEASPASGGLWPAHTLVRSDSERDHRFTERLAFLAASSSLLPQLARTVVHVCVDSGTTPGQTHGSKARAECSCSCTDSSDGTVWQEPHEGKARTSCSVSATPWGTVEFVCLLRAAFSCGEFLFTIPAACVRRLNFFSFSG